MAEGHDWTRTVFEPCPQCGADVGAIVLADLPAAFGAEAQVWSTLVPDGDDEAWRWRRGDGTWSALEYAGHVDELLGVMAERMRRLTALDGADIGWWDHEVAVVDNAYNDRDRDDLVGSLVAGFTAMAARCDEVGDAWQHSSERRPGERFSVEDLARFTLHESIHHRGDALAVRG